ncbi:DUF1236 domain-containing protein [Chthonobacter albigriseus]|uniref:DUF1236 domain-containing protein n=1 Tax=Chthonobacter albigriseus TaxID=1683161 RepID=UPI0015EE8530|nr:DUF1236 domain-containing protein [Chthonobacter albigriseus]
MRKSIPILAAVLISASAMHVQAQEGTVSGAAGGAVTGAIVGGPIGAAVGGVAGAALGTVLAPPTPEVQSYVVQQQVPSIAIQEPIVVGQPLPPTVQLYEIPQAQGYTYTVVNNQRVIVDPQTRTVIQVVQ